MQQEYKMAKGWAIFVWIVLPIMMIAFGLMEEDLITLTTDKDSL